MHKYWQSKELKCAKVVKILRVRKKGTLVRVEVMNREPGERRLRFNMLMVYLKVLYEPLSELKAKLMYE